MLGRAIEGGAQGARTDELASDSEERSHATPRIDEPSQAALDVERSTLHVTELVQGSQVGRYSVLRRIGQGGMGVVYKAWDPQLDRPVALKVLRHERREPTDSDEERRDALIREAKTLARFSHPNIVTVFDAGPTAGGVFIAMELCEGHDLRQWLGQERRSVREILDVFVRAGRGLSAAHAAGIVHRDFKPANVLISEDGSVRVADFGLARLRELSAEAGEDTEEPSDTERPVSTIAGTPTYMAPEQLMGRVGDHRLDQFSFCLSLYAALIGRPAFPGRTYQERRAVVPHGLGTIERERLQHARQVPVRVRRALLRGLEVDPQRRHPSMEELLARLEEQRRGPWITVTSTLVVGLGLGAGLVLGLGSSPPSTPCPPPGLAMMGTWDEDDRERVKAAFLDTELDQARPMLERTTAVLDEYTRGLSDAFADSCEATYVTRQQSEARFDAQVQCLRSRRARLQSTIDAIAAASSGAELQDRIVAPLRLPPVAECEDADHDDAWSMPEDPALRKAIERERRRLDVAHTMLDAGDQEGGAALTASLVENARSLGYLPLLAPALELRGTLQANLASAEDAEHTLRDAIGVAAQTEQADVEARAWASLLFSLARSHRHQEAEALLFPAEASLRRSGDEEALAWFHNSAGMLFARLREHGRAAQHLQASLELKRRRLGDTHVDVAIAWSNLGNVYVEHQRWDDARHSYRRALRVYAQTVGPTHRLYQVARFGLCGVELGASSYADALDLCRGATESFERGSEPPDVMGVAYYRTARVLAGLERLEEATAMGQRAREQWAESRPDLAELMDAWLEDPSPAKMSRRPSKADDRGGAQTKAAPKAATKVTANASDDEDSDET